MPMDSRPDVAGHATLEGLVGLPQSECRGFVITKTIGSYSAVNFSHLNGPQGQPGSLLMPPSIFNDIVKALQAAGL